MYDGTALLEKLRSDIFNTTCLNMDESDSHQH